jgi:alpha-galactosidase
MMRLLAVLSLLLLATPSPAQTVDPNRLPPHLDPNRTPNGLAMTPPMGWNSWNKFGCNVNEALIRRTADAIAASGMRDAGYRYVVIDDCWEGPRDEAGNITADRERFPSGMRTLSDYVHQRGLLFGLYSDAGRTTCGGRPGSQGYEFQDARTYAGWGVDYLKYDWCATGTRNAEEAYALMADALRATGRDIVLSICEWGNNQPWLWAANIGNLWRTTGDVFDRWEGVDRWMHGVMDIVESNEPLWPYAGPGHWNDPDMLEVGNGGMSDSEYRAHFSLWAMMAAPLMAGNDVAAMDSATRDILTNREVIAIDQDALGRQGRRVWRDGGREVWVRPLADGGRAVLLLNRGDSPAEIEAGWTQLGYAPRLRARVRDLWLHRDLPRATGRVAATVQPHAVVMLRVTLQSSGSSNGPGGSGASS